jgi:hypothetical protein
VCTYRTLATGWKAAISRVAILICVLLASRAADPRAGDFDGGVEARRSQERAVQVDRAKAETEIPEIIEAGDISRTPEVASISPQAPPRLQGSVEARNGQLSMILENLDRRRAFSGIARVTLSDGEKENDLAPVVIDLQPGEEKIIPINCPINCPINGLLIETGFSVLTIYDERQAVRMIRSVPFGKRPKTELAIHQQSVDQSPDQTIPEPAAEWDATAIVDQSLGEDDESDSANSANAANWVRQTGSRIVTTSIDPTIEGGSNPPQKISKPNKLYFPTPYRY